MGLLQSAYMHTHTRMHAIINTIKIKKKKKTDSVDPCRYVSSKDALKILQNPEATTTTRLIN